MRLPVRTTLLQNGALDVHTVAAVRLPVRTTLLQNAKEFRAHHVPCDYQSERHCSKTLCLPRKGAQCAITSQNDTAPKPISSIGNLFPSAITSQNDTAPKPIIGNQFLFLGAITSQNDTAPKQMCRTAGVLKGAITSQNDTAPKPPALADC